MPRRVRRSDRHHHKAILRKSYCAGRTSECASKHPHRHPLLSASEHYTAAFRA